MSVSTEHQLLIALQVLSGVIAIGVYGHLASGGRLTATYYVPLAVMQGLEFYLLFAGASEMTWQLWLFFIVSVLSFSMSMNSWATGGPDVKDTPFGAYLFVLVLLVGGLVWLLVAGQTP